MNARTSNVVEPLLKAAIEKGSPVSKVIDMNAAVAEELLARNANNRKLTADRVAKIRHDIESGHWMLNYQPIIVSSDGVLADGQHRAAAVAGTGLVAPINLVVGVPPEARITMDQTRPRNAGDFLTMQGEQLGGLEASIVRLDLAYEQGDRETLKGAAGPTASDILGFFAAHAEQVRASAKLADELRDDARYHVGAPVLGFVHYVLSGIDPQAAEQYVRQVAKGEAITEGDPPFIVRKRLLDIGRAGAAKKVEVLFSGWNAFRDRKPLKQVRITGRLPALH